MVKTMRPQILFPLFAPVTSLKGVGGRLAPLIEKVAGPLVRDLAFLAPQALVRRPRRLVAEAQNGETPILTVRILAHAPSRRRGLPYQIRAADASGEVTLTWFAGYGDHLAEAHPVGAERVVSGKLEHFRDRAVIAHPDYLLPAERVDDIPLVEPVYPATEGLSSRQVRRFALQAVAKVPDLPEWRPSGVARQREWPSFRAAIEALHAPVVEADLSLASPARQRLAYDEFLAHQLALARRRALVTAEPGPVIRPGAASREIQQTLPFALTGAQERCLAEIRGDLGSGRRMSRLLQGDVGSGKTVVATLVIADAAGAKQQSALMAPTDILARQHFETIAPALSAVGLEAVLLTGRDKGAARSEKLQALASGRAMAAIGTHALFQDEVRFKELGVVIIDEQHRFGVSERRRLQSKGSAPHLLALSATPIPRTLELTMFGDLEVSRLDEKPAGRQPVDTTTSPSTRLPEIVRRLHKAVQAGSQAFWICPLVSESANLDVTAAEDRAARLKDVLGDGVGLVHGQMPAAQKDRVMQGFAAGDISVLVATTVVEVGVNVPRATIMVVEHAERFGLAQLHQLRGRVGRGAAKSACLLLYDPPISAAARSSLEILRATDDGFLIAERDLEIRGGGDPIGLRQSGFPDYRFADPIAHRDLLLMAAEDVRTHLSRDPRLESERGRTLQILDALYDWSGRAGWEKAG